MEYIDEERTNMEVHKQEHKLSPDFLSDGTPSWCCPSCMEKWMKRHEELGFELYAPEYEDEKP